VSPSMTPEERYQRLSNRLLSAPGVTQSSDVASPRKGFGSSALKIDDRTFAMLSSKREFVVKLPAHRVDALISAGKGKRFDAGRDRPMKEWLAVGPASEARWLPLAREAMKFVSSKG
jgi:hypothetical protein